MKHREAILDQQFVQARLGDIATELFMASSVYARLAHVASDSKLPDDEQKKLFETGRLYLKLAQQRNQQRFTELKSNADKEMNRVGTP